jgi:hypothetical protein
MQDQNNNSQKRELSKEASLYLWGSDVFDRYEEFLKSLGENDERVAELSALVFELCEARITPDEFVAAIEHFGIEKGKAVQLAVQVYSSILLKIADDLPFDVQAQIEAFGVSNVVAQPKEEKPDVQKYIEQYVAGLPGDVEERFRHRLESILLAYVKGLNNKTQIIERLKRSMKLDGLELEEQEAQDVIEKFDENKKGKSFIEPPVRQIVSEPIMLVADETQEIEEIKQKTAQVANVPVLADVQAVVGEVCDHEAFGFGDPLLNDRCKKIVDSRVRGVRDTQTVRAQIERPVDKGGLGVGGRRLADMLERIEQTVSGYEAQQRKKHEEEKAHSVDEKIKKQEERQEAKKNEESGLDEKFKKLIEAHGIDTEKMRGAVEGVRQAQKTTPKIYAPTMQEIAFEKRLTGPIDELRTMTLADFRRLSRDPRQAAIKIKDKIGYLEDQGYDQKIEGIRAWRGSPLNALYLQFTHEALLAGKGIKEVLDAKAEDRGETMTTDEFHAIMAINEELRF